MSCDRELVPLLFGIAKLGYRGAIQERPLSSLLTQAKDHGVEATLAAIDDDPGLLLVQSACPRWLVIGPPSALSFCHDRFMREKVKSRRSKSISLRMDLGLVERLAGVATPRRLPLSYIIREACWEYIDKLEDEADWKS
jgi:hypothetical protein